MNLIRRVNCKCLCGKYVKREGAEFRHSGVLQKMHCECAVIIGMCLGRGSRFCFFTLECKHKSWTHGSMTHNQGVHVLF